MFLGIPAVTRANHLPPCAQGIPSVVVEPSLGLGATARVWLVAEPKPFQQIQILLVGLFIQGCLGIAVRSDDVPFAERVENSHPPARFHFHPYRLR
jgi:hypothetical protein